MATNLEFITSIDANTGASSVSIDNVFNKGYEVYFVTVTGLNINGNRSPFMRLLDSSGSEITSSIYDRASLAMFSGSSFGEYRNVNSNVLLKKVVDLINSKNYEINNIDINIIAQKPKIKKYSKKMKENISKICNLKIDKINIKGKTSEKLGLIGSYAELFKL